MLRIGPSGNSLSFYNEGNKHTYQAAAWLNARGLNAFEYSFGRGVSMSDGTAEKIKQEFEKYDIEISAHAPYYTNFANPSDEMIEKSIMYITQSIQAVKKMGGSRVVFHPASCGKATREEAVARAKRNIAIMMDRLEGDFVLAAETMGKLAQIGTAEEIIDFCTIDERLVPCFDFGHINSYTKGGLKTKDDYRRIIDLSINKLGIEQTKNMHVHFSKIMYGASGEIKHLTFEDQKYGPEYLPLAEIIDEYGLTPFVVCESDGTMAEDAIIMKNCHKSVY
ncbi:MAG: TIM barrel protein [Clostridia bacterium]|nr:TIM barrel protein [Clostridia bacterium]